MVRYFRRFFELEAASGILLLVITALAIVAENSAAAPYYREFTHLNVGLTIGSFEVSHSLAHWINDGLMVIFFLMVGLEIKRELLVGQLATRRQALLPSVAAAGGMLMPALIFALFNLGHPEGIHGWAIPAATDIAFALGILSLLGNRVPTSLKVFLTALAVIDDLGAVLLIALFYTTSLNASMLLGAGIVFGMLIFLNRKGVLNRGPYVALGFLLWIFVLQSGIHATVAGVLLASTIPLRSKGPRQDSPLEQIEHGIQPFVAFGIMPLFAFVNAGLNLDSFNLHELQQSVPLGIIFGLFVGKQIGVFATAWLAIRFGWAKLPRGSSWMQLYGVALLTGIGFTMSLFVGSLAYKLPILLEETRLGVLTGSALSAFFGLIILWRYSPVRKSESAEDEEAAQDGAGR